MVRIKFSGLPPEILKHLKQRALERKVPYRDLLALERWRASEPMAPEGNWWKDFGSFRLCGRGEFPKTVLLPEMKPFGEKIR